MTSDARYKVLREFLLHTVIRFLSSMIYYVFQFYYFVSCDTGW